MSQFKDKTIIMTGGSGGLGEKLTTALTKSGAKVITLGRRPAENAFQHINIDLKEKEAITSISEQIQALNPDILINLAAVQYCGFFDEQSSPSLDEIMQINLISAMQLTKILLPQFKEKNQATIVNIGSVFGSLPFPHYVSYSATKAGLKAFSTALRRELSGSNIDIVHIEPRAIQTPMNETATAQILKKSYQMKMDSPDFVVQQILNTILQKKKNKIIGTMESLFVKINGLFPSLIDTALKKQIVSAHNDLKQAK